LHGGVGLGKTHLLEGIAQELRNRFPSLQVVHMTAENFTNYFTVALRQHALPSFRQKFRNADVLLLDDVDFLDGKRGIQEELLHTFKHLEAHGRQIVLTSDRHPRLLTRTSEELKTRFMSGMVCRLDAPGPETRRRILDRKAERLSGEFNGEALNYIAQRFRNNVRELEGALRTLQAYYTMTGKRVGITAARQILSDLERDCIKVVKLSDIERVVCDVFGLMQEELRSNKRVRSVSQPRMLAMYLARKHTRSAYSEIGAYFGGRNHSTVITAEKKIATLLNQRYQMNVAAEQYSVADVIENIEQQLSQAG
ncbi:MAG: AAA family ATPase, partial [Planctomycetaceae bacterium]|nr:AAA family ATPase [Planctomycetaceae bacterium]